MSNIQDGQVKKRNLSGNTISDFALNRFGTTEKLKMNPKILKMITSTFFHLVAFFIIQHNEIIINSATVVELIDPALAS